VIAQAEVKTILKTSGENYKKQREANKDSHHE
jgi:molybdopterin-containing oxidoreductase family membrane subunit